MAYMKEPGRGEYYPRISRPALGRAFVDTKAYSGTLVALRLLNEGLQAILEVVEPETPNLAAYGHKTRIHLISACTEVEAALVGVLKANNYPGDRWTTRDYVKLLGPLRLEEYEVHLPLYPDFPSFCPFADWDVAKPTESLSWYDAYNRTKHDRESHLIDASLTHAIHATGGFLVAAASQFPDGYFSFTTVSGSILLAVSATPNLAIDNYHLPEGDKEWRAIPYPW